MTGLVAAGAFPLVGIPGMERTPGVSTEKPRAICVFSKQLQWLEYDAMAETAAAIGFDGIDLTVRPGGHVLPERVEDDLPRAVEAVRKAGLSVPMMTTAVVDARDPHTEPILRTAAGLGITHYRLGYLSYDAKKGIVGSLDAYRPQMEELAAMNERYGLHGGYQNHAGTRVGAPVWDLWLLLKDLNPHYIGCQYDVRHAVLEGGNSWVLGMNLIAPFIKSACIKDFVWEKREGRWRGESVPLGEGMVDFEQYFAILNEIGFRGPLSIHYEYPLPGDKESLDVSERRRQYVAVMRKDVETLRSMMKVAPPAAR